MQDCLDIMENSSGLTYGDVANKLLQDNFLLTALELHTELIEAGREVPQLKEFFSNPGNFERPAVDITAPIPRSPSQATLDSLDLTRLSEDGERSCSDVAVLEFELRKARETINSLRANLTQVADFETSSVDIRCEKPTRDGPLKAHEKRALNFLINEYLLNQDYKLTSITFADEIPEQDFEDWDDVGLNIPRPAGLISLYREDGTSSGSNVEKKCVSVEVQTDLVYNVHTSEEENVESLQEKSEEILLLKKQILALETEKLNFQKLYDAALASLNSLSSPTSDMPSSETTLYTLHQPFKDMSLPKEEVQTNSCPEDEHEQDLQPLTHMATQNYYGSSVSTNSITPDQFEMIDCDKNGGSSQKDGSNTSSFEPAVFSEEMMINSPKSSDGSRIRRDESIVTLEDTLSFNEEWPKMPCAERSEKGDSSVIKKNEAWINCSIPSDYKMVMLKACNISYSKNSQALREMTGTTRAITPQRLVCVVSDTLPKIVPNLLVAKRDEVVGLLVCAIFLQPEQCQRERLLQLLLSLKKKIDRDDRALIISGLVLLLQWNMEINCGLDSELLGLCWEMLNSKSVEKRILGAEATIAAAPYVSVELVSSLLLSMVVSMCDSNDSYIRRQGVLGAILVSPTALARGPQLEGLLHVLLGDKENDVVEMCITYLAPVLARSALLERRFHSEFSKHTLEKLRMSLKECKKELMITMLKVLTSTLSAAFVYVINVSVLKSNMKELNASSYVELNNKIAKQYFAIHLICHPKFLIDDKTPVGHLVETFYELTESNSSLSWSEKDWFLETYINAILDSFKSDFPYSDDLDVVMTYIELFDAIKIIFGKFFVKQYVRKKMEQEISVIEQKLAKLEGQKCAEAVIVSVYLGAILGCESGDEEVVEKVVKRWLVCSGMCGISCTVLGIPIVWYSLHNTQYLDIALRALWESIVHSSEQVRSFTGKLLTFLICKASLPENVFTSNVMPAIVTLLSDSTVLVKCSAIDGFGAVVCRSTAPATAVDKAWLSLEGLAKDDPPCRTATRLVVAFREILSGGDAITANKVLPSLSSLCHNSLFNGENLSHIRELLNELLPALQMATHEDITDHFLQSVLMPALKNISRLDHLLLSEHKSAIEALIHKVTSNSTVKDSRSTASVPSHHISAPSNSLPHILSNPESVGRRVTQMFQHSKPAMNLQNIFKKKT